jgi:hypothetical protein
VNPPRNRKGENGNPSPSYRRARFLSQQARYAPLPYPTNQVPLQGGFQPSTERLNVPSVLRRTGCPLRIDRWPFDSAWTCVSIPALRLLPISCGPPLLQRRDAAKTIGLKIPVAVAKERWPRSRWVNLSIGLGSSILIAILARKAICAPESAQKVLLLIIAGVVSLAVNAFKDVILPK